MNSTIDFDHQLFRPAIEIDYKRTNTDLSPKLSPIKLLSTKRCPQNDLAGRWCFPQLASDLLHSYCYSWRNVKVFVFFGHYNFQDSQHLILSPLPSLRGKGVGDRGTIANPPAPPSLPEPSSAKHSA